MTRYLSIEKPIDFNPSINVVASYLISRGKILLLKRNESRHEGGKWGSCAGKVEDNEDNISAALREIWEETKIQVKTTQLIFKFTFYVRYPDFDYYYHTYTVSGIENEEIKLNPRESTDYTWIKPEEALLLPLVRGEDESIRKVFNII